MKSHREYIASLPEDEQRAIEAETKRLRKARWDCLLLLMPIIVGLAVFLLGAALA